MAENIKIAIGSAIPVDQELSMHVKGRDFITGFPRSTEIKTNEIVKAITKELRDMIKAIKDVLQETPPGAGFGHHRRRHHSDRGHRASPQSAGALFRRTGVGEQPPKIRSSAWQREQAGCAGASGCLQEDDLGEGLVRLVV